MAPRVAVIFDHDRMKDTAAHVCVAHCPVKSECAELGELVPNSLRRNAVYGGRKYTSDGRKLVDPTAARIAPWCLLCPPRRYVPEPIETGDQNDQQAA